jgi:hypothetical protein
MACFPILLNNFKDLHDVKVLLVDQMFGYVHHSIEGRLMPANHTKLNQPRKSTATGY